MITFIIVIVLLVLLVFLIPIILHKIYVKQNEKYLKNIQGPKPNALFGNMLDFMVPTYEFLNVQENYVKKYGPIVKIYNGPLSTLVLVEDEKLIEHILKSSELIEKANTYKYFHNWLGFGLLTSTGLKWKQRRRMITPAFHFSILENFVPIFERVGDIFIKKLETYVGKETFDMCPLVTLCTLDIICESAMGTSVNAQLDGESKYVKAIKEMCRIITKRNFSPLALCLYPLTIDYFKEKGALKVIHSHTDAVIEKKIKEMKNCNEDYNIDIEMKKKMAFLDLLLLSTIDDKPLSKTDIREEVHTFMFEGHDTTSSAIAFALYALANHPVIQQKALEEQREIFPKLKSAAMTMTDLQNMKYLELVIKETLRLYPSVPVFARNVSKEFEWEGNIFPKNQQINILVYNCHRNEKYFPKPLEFNPERFMDRDSTHPYRYIPFSAGPRNCIGQKFAMLEMKSIISKVLRNFELLPAKPTCELKLVPEIVLVSKSGIHLSLKKRV